MTQFVFKNEGKMSLKNLHISCNHPDVFSLDTQLTPEEISFKDSTYEMLDGGSARHSPITQLASTRMNKPVQVLLDNDQLPPNAEISVPVWIHGIATPGVHELDFLFYYEPLDRTPGVQYRVLHQTVRIQTLATLNVSASVRTSSSRFFRKEIDNKQTDR